MYLGVDVDTVFDRRLIQFIPNHIHRLVIYSCDYSVFIHSSFRGENCLHMLARYSKENAAAIFSLLMQTAPGFPIDVQDRDGNTGTHPSSSLFVFPTSLSHFLKHCPLGHISSIYGISYVLYITWKILHTSKAPCIIIIQAHKHICTCIFIHTCIHM